MSPVRAIFDTNVFVGAAFNPRSASARLLGAARDGRIAMVWCDATQAEIQRILKKIPPISWEAVEDLFRIEHCFGDALDLDAVHFVDDPEDRKFAALSIQAGAPVISSDNHLLNHPDRLAVWTPSAFVAAYLPQHDAS